MREGWQLIAAAVAVVVAAALMLLRAIREQAWVEAMRATGCWPLIPLTDIVLLGWGAAALTLVAGILLLLVGRRALRDPGRRSGPSLLVAAGLVLAAALVLILVALTAPADPLLGVDGSGVPCPSG